MAQCLPDLPSLLIWLVHCIRQHRISYQGYVQAVLYTRKREKHQCCYTVHSDESSKLWNKCVCSQHNWHVTATCIIVTYFVDCPIWPCNIGKDVHSTPTLLWVELLQNHKTVLGGKDLWKSSCSTLLSEGQTMLHSSGPCPVQFLISLRMASPWSVWGLMPLFFITTSPPFFLVYNNFTYNNLCLPLLILSPLRRVFPSWLHFTNKYLKVAIVACSSWLKKHNSPSSYCSRLLIILEASHYTGCSMPIPVLHWEVQKWTESFIWSLSSTK